MPAIGGIFFVLYFCFVIAVGIFTLVMFFKFVTAHERIAAALERAASNLERDRK